MDSQKYIDYIRVEPEDGLITVKVENDATVPTKIVQYQVTTPNEAEKSNATNTNNDRLLSELSTLREKYNQVVFDLQKSKETVNLFESEKESMKVQAAKNTELLILYDAEKKSLLQQLEKCNKENEDHVSNFHRKKQAEATEMKKLKKENNELRAQLKQVQASIIHDKSSGQKSLKENKNDVFEVETLLDHKEEKSGRLFLVRWKGFGPSDDLWVPESNLQCPSLLKTYLKHNQIK